MVFASCYELAGRFPVPQLHHTDGKSFPRMVSTVTQLIRIPALQNVVTFKLPLGVTVKCFAVR